MEKKGNTNNKLCVLTLRKFIVLSYSQWKGVKAAWHFFRERVREVERQRERARAQSKHCDCQTASLLSVHILIRNLERGWAAKDTHSLTQGEKRERKRERVRRGKMSEDKRNSRDRAEREVKERAGEDDWRRPCRHSITGQGHFREWWCSSSSWQPPPRAQTSGLSLCV